MMHPAFSFGRGEPDDEPGMVGRWWMGASDLAVLLDEINDRFSQTETEFGHALLHKKITVTQYDRFKSLATEWREFYNFHTGKWFVFRIVEAPAIADRADLYDLDRLNLRNWLTSLAPDDTPGPDSTVTPPPKPEEPTPWYLNVKTVAALVGAGAVAYVAGPPLVAWAGSAIAARTAKKLVTAKKSEKSAA